MHDCSASLTDDISLSIVKFPVNSRNAGNAMKGLPSQAPDSLAMHSAVVEAYESVLLISYLQLPIDSSSEDMQYVRFHRFG